MQATFVIPSVISTLREQADKAHQAARFDEEIDIRKQLSHKAWATFSLNPQSLDEYARYNIIELNDLPLGLLLEGLWEAIRS